MYIHHILILNKQKEKHDIPIYTWTNIEYVYSMHKSIIEIMHLRVSTARNMHIMLQEEAVYEKVTYKKKGYLKKMDHK